MTVTDLDKKHPLYQIDQNSGAPLFSSKPHMTISQSTSKAVVGTVTFHSWSRTIDLEVHGRPIPFESEGMFTRAYAYSSPAFGERLRWECDGIWRADLILVNSRQEWIARFESSMFSMSKEGKIHVVNGAITGPALDEIMVSGSAMVQLQRRRRSSSGGGGGGGGA